MKLTDEQRDMLDVEFNSGCEVYNGMVHVPYEAFKLVSKLLSSEQAWKEEAERQKERKYVRMRERDALQDQLEEAKRVTMEVSAALVESTMQLNQAKELLKEVYEREGWLKIKDFLSSLGEK